MVWKTLPGLGIALALGVFFCLSGGDREGRHTWRDRNVRVEHQYSAATPTDGSVFRLFRPAPATPAAVDTAFAGEDILAMRPPAPLPGTENPPAPPTRIRAADFDPPPGRPAAPRHFYGLTSGMALASLASGQTSTALPTAHSPSFAYPTLPPKGVAVWGKGMMYKETKDASNLFLENAYSHDGAVYSLGATYDWSVDSTLGLSFDYLQAELAGKYVDESRRTDTAGYFVNAHYNGALFGQVPFRARAMYGWIEQDTSGWADDWSTWERFPWNEEKHDSRMFGFSASLLYPLMSSYGIRITPEIGFDYRNLRTKQFTVALNDSKTLQLDYPAMDAVSFNSYLSATISRDFQQVWGVVTPRFSCGYSLESSDTAGGVRALGASAAYPVYIDSDTMAVSEPRFDIGPKRVWTYNLGIDMKILGGWDVSAGYEKKTGLDYDKDSFSLEISRCF